MHFKNSIFRENFPTVGTLNLVLSRFAFFLVPFEVNVVVGIITSRIITDRATVRSFIGVGGSDVMQ